MSNPTNTDTFASHSLLQLKRQIAAEIRHQMHVNNLLYKNAIDIFGLSMTMLSNIMNHKEDAIRFENLYSAAVNAGITVSMQLSVPD